MDGKTRPTTKELDGKLKGAAAALNGKDGKFADPPAAVSELMALGIGDSSEVWELIRKLIPEILAEKYVGSRPPMKAYENKIEGKELFAFAWDSPHLSKRMYLKFVLQGGDFFYVSLHEDRPPGR